MDGLIAYALSKRYTEETCDGLGFLKGANATIDRVDDILDSDSNIIGKNIVFLWTGVSGATQYTTVSVMNGESSIAQGYLYNGKFYKDAAHTTEIPAQTNTLYTDKSKGGIYFWDGTAYREAFASADTQVTTLPTASADYEGKIYQYIGNTTATLTKGYFYQCVNNSGTYAWEQIDVQAGGGADNIVEGYFYNNKFYLDLAHTQEVAGKAKTLYIDVATNLQYRYDGVNFVNIGGGDSAQVTSMPAPNMGLLGRVLQYVGNTTVTYTKGYFYTCVENSGVYEWQNIPVQPASSEQIQTMPVPSSENVGRIVQYVGATDSNYTNGYYYQCVEDTTSTPSTYSWVQKNVQPGGGADNVIEGYYNPTDGKFYEDDLYTTEIPGESNKVYFSVESNFEYRWDGVKFVNVNTLSRELTKAQYEALSPAIQRNGMTYYITDDDSDSDVEELTNGQVASLLAMIS